jgi:hypothetical protein
MTVTATLFWVTWKRLSTLWRKTRMSRRSQGYGTIANSMDEGMLTRGAVLTDN